MPTQLDISSYFSPHKKQKTDTSSVKSEESKEDDFANSLNNLEHSRKNIKTYSRKQNLIPSRTTLEPVQIEDFNLKLPDEPTVFPKKEKKSTNQPPIKKPKLEQMYLDLGQKNFSPITCEECGMLYTPGHPQEEAAHNQHHNGYGNLTFRGWKDERVVKRLSDSDRIICVCAEDLLTHGPKIKAIKNIMDKELGYVESSTGTRNIQEEKMYMFVRKRKVIGCAIAEPVDTAFHIKSEDDPPSQGTNSIVLPSSDKNSDDIVRCSKEPVEATCGISRIWVLQSERRKGVASKLLDAIRGDFVYGFAIPKEKIAFTQPTPNGKSLFKKYTGTKNFLVYTPEFS